MRRSSLATALVVAALALVGCSSSTSSSADTTPSQTVTSSSSPTGTTTVGADAFPTYVELATAFDAMFGTGGPTRTTTPKQINGNLAEAKIKNVTAEAFEFQPLEICLKHTDGTRLIGTLPADYSTITLRFTQGTCDGTDSDDTVTFRTADGTVIDTSGSDTFAAWARAFAAS